MTTTQRKYAYIKVDTGDYLLASNDRQTILRFQAHDEDGSAEWGDGTKIVGTFWDVLCKPASTYPEDGFVFDLDMERWLAEDWRMAYSMNRSRREAEANVSEFLGGIDASEECSFFTDGCCGDPDDHDYCGMCPLATAEHPDRNDGWPGKGGPA